MLDDDERMGRLVLPERQQGPLRQVTIRALVGLSCLLFTAVLVYLNRDGYRDTSGEPITFISALYYSTISLSTTGYGDIVPVTPFARIANIIIVTPLRMIFLVVLVGTTVEVLTRRTREATRERSWRRHVNHHTVVIGFGVKGRAAVATLLQSGERRDRIVVVTKDPVAITDASRMGVVGVLGDARREDVLRQAEVDLAAKVIVAANEDDSTVLITLAAKRLNPNAVIVAAARESNNSDLIKASGASSVIPTAEASGQLMGLATVAPEAGEFMEDLLDPGKGLEVIQRPVTRDEVGMTPSSLQQRGQIALGVIRDGRTVRFDEPGIKVFQLGDQVIAIQESHNNKK